MAATVTIGVQQFLSVDIQTMFYNRGTVSAIAPNIMTPVETLTSRTYEGNLIEVNRPAKAIRDGQYLNKLHGNQVFVGVTGYKWRQWRTLAAAGALTINPRFDCESVFVISDAGNTDVTLNLTHTDLLPGMTFKFARPESAGNLVITLTNGVVMDPTDGTTGTTITVTQYGFVTLRILGSIISGGPKVFIEEAANYVVA